MVQSFICYDLFFLYFISDYGCAPVWFVVCTQFAFSLCPWLSAPLLCTHPLDRYVTSFCVNTSLLCTHPLDRCLRVPSRSILSPSYQLLSSGYEPCALADLFRLRHPPAPSATSHPAIHPSNPSRTLYFASFDFVWPISRSDCVGSARSNVFLVRRPRIDLARSSRDFPLDFGSSVAVLRCSVAL